MSTNIKCKKESKLTKWLKAPLRMLMLANNFYVKSFAGFSEGAALGCPTGQVVYSLPRSFSASSASTASNRDDDYRELSRAASAKSPRSKIAGFQKPGGGNSCEAGRLPRARSVSTVGIGRIDEDKPCDFQDDFKARSIGVLPRSKSSALFKRGASKLL